MYFISITYISITSRKEEIVISDETAFIAQSSQNYGNKNKVYKIMVINHNLRFVDFVQ